MKANDVPRNICVTFVNASDGKPVEEPTETHEDSLRSVWSTDVITTVKIRERTIASTRDLKLAFKASFCRPERRPGA
jgi:hypothetical protein